MNHALLPSIKDAALPAKYEAARMALAECDRIDECKAWSDKAAALASYAKQAKDKGLVHVALRIHARATRRCGELLKQIEKAHGKRPNKIRAGADPNSETRKDAAKEAGLSPRQAKDAIRVANVDPESFEAQVESENPPTVTALAGQGKKPTKKPVPFYVQRGQTKEEFQAGIKLEGALRGHARALKAINLDVAVRGWIPEEVEAAKGWMEEIEKTHKEIRSKL
jgi:hypothetical protein